MTLHRTTVTTALLVAFSALSLPASSPPGVNVLTQHNDNYRSGANTNERVLNTTNVNVENFGKLFARKVDGQIYAQPLYVSGLKIAGRRRNVVYVATEHNTVYAFDADDPARAEPLWSTNLGPSCPNDRFSGGPGGRYLDLTPEVGITGTPVIDLKSATIFVVAKTYVLGLYYLKLHGLNLITGAEGNHSPVEIKPTLRGKGDGSSDGFVTLNPWKQFNRPGLLLSNGVVYVAMGSHGDFPPYHGWVSGFDIATLQQVGIINSTPDGAAGSFWNSGNGPITDDLGNIYFMSGNGSFSGDTGGRNYGNALMKFRQMENYLRLNDWFVPHNQEELNADDLDLGASGPVFLPDARIIIGGGKEGVLYVWDPDNLGHYDATRDHVLQEFPVTKSHIHGAPVYWHSPDGLRIYLWPENEYLQAYQLNGRILTEKPISQSVVRVPWGMPGGFLSLSADGSKPGTGIVWAMHSYEGDANRVIRTGIVEAFDASDLSKELWNSRQFLSRDDLGLFAKMSAPTIAGGKVYVPTFSGELAVYGLLPKDKRGAPVGTPSPIQSDTPPPPPEDGWNPAPSPTAEGEGNAG